MEGRDATAGGRTAGDDGERSATCVVVVEHEVHGRALVESLVAAGIDVVGDTPNCDAGADLVRSLRPDVVVVGHGILVSCATLLAELLRAERLPTRCVVISARVSSAELVRLRASGAAGVVALGSPPDVVVRAIHEVIAGRSFVDPAAGGDGSD